MFELTREQILKLVRQVAETRTEEIDCDQMVRVLTSYADRLARGEASVLDDELVQHHLQYCVECLEEFEMFCGIITDGSMETGE